MEGRGGERDGDRGRVGVGVVADEFQVELDTLVEQLLLLLDQLDNPTLTSCSRDFEVFIVADVIGIDMVPPPMCS